MKNKLKTIFGLLTLLAFNCAYSQEKPKPVNTDQGYWIIEHNTKTPRQSQVYYYNQNNNLVFKEAFTGKKINCSRRKHVKMLNKHLNEAIIAFENKQNPGNQKQIAIK